MKQLSIHHSTEYQFSSPVKLEQHTLMIRPRSGHDVRVEGSTLHIDPVPTIIWRRDLYNNSVATLDFSKGETLFLRIVSDVTVQQFEHEADELKISDTAENWPFVYESKYRLDLLPFQTPTFWHDQDMIGQWVNGIIAEHSDWKTADLLARLANETAQNFGYAMREEAGVQSPAETLYKREGSCRDFATLFIEACRYLGLAARFVSGYLYAPDMEAAATTTHAWSEVYLPGLGWQGFDNTSGRFAGGDHIATAIARHPEMVPPVSGSFFGPGGTQSSMYVNVQVREMV